MLDWWLWLIIVIVGLLLCCGCLLGPLGGFKILMRQLMHSMGEPKAVPPPPGITVQRDIEFVQTADGPLLLDLFKPTENPIQSSSKALPVVVFLFAGSWFGGNKNQHQMYNVVELLCGSGYAVVGSQYRFSVSTLGYTKSTFPAQANDTRATIKWIRQNAEKQGLDPNAIGVWGASAGAQLGALLGTIDDESSKVQAVVSYYGPTHLPNLATENPKISWILEDLLGGKLEKERLRLAELGSPLLHITSNSAPFLIVHGKKDDVVPISQAEEMHAKLQEKGIESTLIIKPEAGHGTPANAFNSKEDKKRVVDFFDKHLKK